MPVKEKERNKRIFRGFTQAFIVLCSLIAWEVIVSISGQQSLIPPPSAAISALYELLIKGILIEDLRESIYRVLIGFLAAAISGTAIGLALGSSARLHLALTPLIELLRPIPPIAWIPLSMSIFGLGDGSACFVIFIGAFYPILTNTILGVREVPQTLLDAAQSLGCTGAARFKKVIWPAALPSIFAGLRVGLGFAWMCVVAAEMIAARSGLGYEIQLNRQLLRLDRVVAGMLVIGVVGFLMNFALAQLETYLLPWRKKSAHPEPEDLPAASASPSAMERKITGASIKLSDLNFRHNQDDRLILNGLNLEVASGETLCLLGPSGCGKTTLLRLLAGLQKPVSGQILIDRGELLQHRDEITMVFQNSALFPWRTALGNVKFALESRGMADQQKALDYLRLVGLHNKAAHYPHELSGGQQQRVALARALAYQPKILLMDEPFASLDSQTRENLQEEVSALLFARGITGVFVTHDIREAMFLGDRVAVMAKNGGEILTLHKIEKTQPREAAFRYTSEFSQSRLLLWTALKEASEKELSQK